VKVRVLIADDHPAFLAGLRRTLSAMEGFEIVAEAKTCAEALTAVDRVRPDVAVIDLGMPGMDGITCIDRMFATHRKLKIVTLSESAEPELVEQVFKHGACTFVVKTIGTRDLGPAIRQGVERTAFHAAGLPAIQSATAANRAGLSERELIVLRAIAGGLSNQLVAKQLWVTQQTVKFHLTNIFRKLGVGNRTEAARWAFAHGLVSDGELDATADQRS
jgi:NarL family two-component system response regulator LiaR